MKYQRMVEVYVYPDLRDEIKRLKQGQTYDQFLRDLIKKESGSFPKRTDSRLSTKKGSDIQ